MGRRGIEEVGKHNGKVLVKINPVFYRPAEVDALVGNYKKAREGLGWRPKTKFQDLVKIMVEADLKLLKK
jgi:GDPmannose 4,6-dehydratase